jgi:hypothetical protein
VVLNFLEHQQNKSRPGNYHYSYSGDLFNPLAHENIAGSIFALKLFYMLGETDERVIKPITDRILTFQKSNGSIYDPSIFRKSFLRNAAAALKRGKFQNLDNHEYIRAETRQAYSCLLPYGIIPSPIYTDIPIKPDQIITYLKKLDWTRPWGAGSHFSHLMFFLSLMHKSGKIDDETFRIAKQTALNEIASLHHKEDGAWYLGNPSKLQKINGAMKILTGMLWTDARLTHPEQLIDLCLSHTDPVHACDQFNKTMVLRYANEATNNSYKREEITLWCEKALKEWQTYFHPEQGGFSFWKARANERYYGAKITQGLNEADIHGTVLFVWGLSMMAKLMPLSEINWIKEMKS